MANQKKQKHPSDKPLNAAQMIMYGGVLPNLQKQEQQKWEDLEKIYKSCMDALITANNEVVALFKIPGVMENIENRQETVIALRGLNKDILFFAEELKMIHKYHEGKTGFIEDENELGTSLQIFEKYHQFQTTYQGVIIPTVISLSEAVGKAASAMQAQVNAAEQGLTDEQNPNIITDVEVKETIVVEEIKDQINKEM